MHTLTIELPHDIYLHLTQTADQMSISVDQLILELLINHLPPVAEPSEHDRVTAVLQAAGLLAEPSAEMQRIAQQGALLSEDAVRQALSRAGGKPLSEIIVEQRGPKT